MMDDELDELLRDAAETYNVPPEPPREAMWEAISRSRDAAGAIPIGGVRRARWIAAAAGIAAVLMAGIVIGRVSRGPADAPATLAANPDVATPANRDSLNRVQLAPPAEVAVTAESTTLKRAGAEHRLTATARVATTRTNSPRGAAGDRANAAANDLASDGAAYRLAVVEHLTRTEVLLTSFRAQAQSNSATRVDAQFAALSRELLGTTRILLATRRGEDPVITRLLQDLEYVLMQLSQYANDGRPVDLDALNQSLDKRNVLPKLRSTIPAGMSASAGT
ncbi:MAG: hypothetical protein ABJE10_06810 [bacterium]